MKRLRPSTTYNITLTARAEKPKPTIWGIYSTLPLGDFIIEDLKIVDDTDSAVTLSWKPIEHDIGPILYEVASPVH